MFIDEHVEAVVGLGGEQLLLLGQVFDDFGAVVFYLGETVDEVPTLLGELAAVLLEVVEITLLCVLVVLA